MKTEQKTEMKPAMKLEMSWKSKEKPSCILRELPEKRERNVKYFETEDHGRAVVVYPEAVHYQKNGKWEEYDHTLKKDPNTGNYRNQSAEYQQL